VKEVATIALMLSGATFMLLAGLGLVRMPDLFNRMQASTKASTLGALLIMAAAGLHFGSVDVLARVALVVVFLFITAPVAAHALARSAYHAGVPLWPGSVRDELGRVRQVGKPGQTGRADQAGQAGGGQRDGGNGQIGV
jgi:multicomponent Na+:H+ antiporter subunit G